jgi:hypothetical protein
MKIPNHRFEFPSVVATSSGTSFAAFAGQVRSRGSEIRTYVAPPVVTPTTITQQAKVELMHLQGALRDARIPNVGVTGQGTTVTVDGQAYQLVSDGQGGISITASAVGLNKTRVDAAVKKLVMLANAYKLVTWIDGNKQLMVEPKVVVEPNGRLKVVTTAPVRVDPRRSSQHQYVLDQLSGGLKAPELERQRQRQQGKRTQTIG